MVIRLNNIFRHDVQVVGFSSDGDSRLLQSMRFNSKFNSPVENNQWFSSHENICFMQDTVHIGTKLRNRLLKPSTVLLIGKKVASISHLKILLNTKSKDSHGLVYSDICPDDRQNYNSLRKIMEPSVSEALAKYVPDSEGTIEYIRICQEVTSSLYQSDLPPRLRIFRLWRSTFFLRAWRQYIQCANAKSNDLNISDNFITQNAYACIELNARNLLISIKKFRDEKLEDLFIPDLFNSQPCEEMFRQMRSMGTINYTKVNFTILELIHLVGRIELMNDIVYFKLADVDVKFPRRNSNESTSNKFCLPSDKEIEDTVLEALNSAIVDANMFGMNVTSDSIKECQLKNVEICSKSGSENDSNSIIDLGINEKNNIIECTSLKDYTGKKSNLNQDSPYMEVMSNTTPKVIAKSSYIWLLSDSKKKISTDRLKRVQDCSERVDRISARRRLEFVDVSPTNQIILKSCQIKVGDWCIFREVNDATEYLLGCILSFRYINGKTKKSKQYSLDFAPVEHASDSRGVEVLAIWHEIAEDSTILSKRKKFDSFLNINRYIATVSDNLIKQNDDGEIRFEKNDSMVIKKVLNELQGNINA